MKIYLGKQNLYWFVSTLSKRRWSCYLNENTKSAIPKYQQWDVFDKAIFGRCVCQSDSQAPVKKKSAKYQVVYPFVSIGLGFGINL